MHRIAKRGTPRWYAVPVVSAHVDRLRRAALGDEVCHLIDRLEIPVTEWQREFVKRIYDGHVIT